jgi:hypothetical protein
MFEFTLDAELVTGARTVLIGLLTSRCGLAACVVFYLCGQAARDCFDDTSRPARIALQPTVPTLSDNHDSPSRARRSTPAIGFMLAVEHKMLWLLPDRDVNPDVAGCKVP